MGRGVHIAARIDTDTLLNHPEQAMQTLSLKIFQRRQELLNELCHTRVTFLDNGETRSGIVDSIDGKSVVIRDNKRKYKILLRSIVS